MVISAFQITTGGLVFQYFLALNSPGAQVDYLVSLDRPHLVGLPEVAQKSGLRIVLPNQFLEEIRKQEGDD